jgi:hypothetical protein
MGGMAPAATGFHPQQVQQQQLHPQQVAVVMQQQATLMQQQGMSAQQIHAIQMQQMQQQVRASRPCG